MYWGKDGNIARYSSSAGVSSTSPSAYKFDDISTMMQPACTLIASEKNQYRTRSLLLLCLLLVKQKIKITVTFLQISRKPQLQSQN